MKASNRSVQIGEVERPGPFRHGHAQHDTVLVLFKRCWSVKPCLPACQCPGTGTTYLRSLSCCRPLLLVRPEAYAIYAPSAASSSPPFFFCNHRRISIVEDPSTRKQKEQKGQNCRLRVRRPQETSDNCKDSTADAWSGTEPHLAFPDRCCAGLRSEGRTNTRGLITFHCKSATTREKRRSNMWMTKKLAITFLIALFSLLIVRRLIVNGPASGISQYQILRANPLVWFNGPVEAQENTPEVAVAATADSSTSNSSGSGNFSPEEFQWLNTWNQLKHLANISNGLPHASEAISDAKTAWENLTTSVQNASSQQRQKERLCPYSIHRMNASKSETEAFTMDIPCGLIVGSSITLIGTAGSLSGNFWIDLVGTALPGESEKPVVLHYNVRLTGDKITQDPVIVQNTFTGSNGWGLEDRCPCTNSNNATKVGNLERCNAMVGREEKNIMNSKHHPAAKKHGEPSTYFPFKQGYLAIATLRVGLERIHMTVDGKHITSFAYRVGLEPWFVNEIRTSGDFKLVSAIASGLPTSEDLENSNLEMLKSSPIPDGKDVDLLIGIFSTANNFKRRMVIRRTWMQYDAVRQGVVAVRFFVGLHTNLMVNKELWNEAHTYGDIEVLPFVDYYSLITWKTLAICIYGTSAVSAKYLMKTDDDAFVRVDEIQSSVKQLNISHGLLYGRINSDSGPHRNPESKWYISQEEWPEEKYPPWAHGPGYVVSQDIAKAINTWYKTSNLKMFKLEDVAMGIWVNDMKKGGLPIKYESDERIDTDGCKDGYIVAHYQEPRQMLCMWEKLLRTNQAACCNNN
ncbi:beta-1,3-galactosyltransferase GALT1-like isoform X2 [Phragmites australis]|uniref:beta-1,3-galactosyltransferase GALT1-like isoform X2 n=1 Tax=Phragmites australis TaxID=29695 RepID=UPI002D7A0286|nr:beta-1,3-galactosyltransferase GALT1-like isoform X2 [Phragmites australis]